MSDCAQDAAKNFDKEALEKMSGDMKGALDREKEGEDVPQEEIDQAKAEKDKALQEKKQKQQPKIDKVLKKCDDYKNQAAELIKVGQYGEAVKVYKKATAALESAVEDFPLFKQELSQSEASIFNNIAVCHKKELNSKLEIEFTSKVIDRA